MRKDDVFKDLHKDDVDDEGESKRKKKKQKKISLTDKNINKLQNYYGIAIRSWGQYLGHEEVYRSCVLSLL